MGKRFVLYKGLRLPLNSYDFAREKEMVMKCAKVRGNIVYQYIRQKQSWRNSYELGCQYLV